MLRGADHEAYEAGFSTGRSQTGTEASFVMKASESASSPIAALSHFGSEGARLCFVVLTTKQTNPASCPAAQGHTKHTNLASSLTGTQAVKQLNLLH